MYEAALQMLEDEYGTCPSKVVCGWVWTATGRRAQGWEIASIYIRKNPPDSHVERLCVMELSQAQSQCFAPVDRGLFA
jgi:hypothetical protein